MVQNIRYATDRKIALFAAEKPKQSNIDSIRKKFRSYMTKSGSKKSLAKAEAPPPNTTWENDSTKAIKFDEAWL